jgi:hypothetical protein
MAPQGSTAPSVEPRRAPGMSTSRKASFWAFATLVVLAVAFYVWWGVSFGVWLDNGVYAVVITLLLFGLAGMWLVLPNPPVASLPPR